MRVANQPILRSEGGDRSRGSAFTALKPLSRAQPGALCFLACLIFLPFLVFAADLTPTQQHDANAIFTNILSPFCPGRTLNDCPTTQASELKNEIKDRLASGESSDQIFNSLLAQFGEDFRAAPEARGFGSLAWLMPVVFLLAGALAILGWIRWRGGAAVAAPIANNIPAVDPEMERRIKAELIDP